MPDRIDIIRDSNSEQHTTFSSEVRGILQFKPRWLVRNGMIVFLTLLIGFIFCTYFIKYPDIVNAKARLSSVNAPKEVKTKVEGRLIRLHASNGDFENAGDLLGFMETSANPYEVMSLSALLDTVSLILEQGQTFRLVENDIQAYKNLGLIQSDYQQFIRDFSTFKQYLAFGFFMKKKKMLQEDLLFFRRLHVVLDQQKSFLEKDVSLSQETFEANEGLVKENVISRLDFRREQSSLIGKNLTLPRINAELILNESAEHDKVKEILALENEIATQQILFLQSLNALQAKLREWQTKYLLIAPIDGRISFSRRIEENQYFSIDEILFYINPDDTRYFAEVFIPQTNFGKVKEGNKVFLRLPAYPMGDFGRLTGRLKFIYDIPTDSGYLAQVDFPNGLVTEYNKTITFKEGLISDVDIVADDRRLSDRIIGSFTNALKP